VFADVASAWRKGNLEATAEVLLSQRRGLFDGQPVVVDEVAVPRSSLLEPLKSKLATTDMRGMSVKSRSIPAVGALKSFFFSVS